MKTTKFKIIAYWFALLLILLAFSCGTKTKQKTELETEKKGREEFRQFDSVQKTEEFLYSKTEEQQRELELQFRQENNTEEEEKTVTEVVEIDAVDTIYFPISDGRYVKASNGRITHTKTTTTGKKKSNETKDENLKISEKNQKKIDSLNNEIISRQAGIQAAKEYIETKRIDTKKTEVKGWKPGFWFWLKFGTISLLLLLLLLVYFFRKWIGRLYPPLQFFKFFRPETT